jgi:hypothetical protein
MKIENYENSLFPSDIDKEAKLIKKNFDLSQIKKAF